MVLFEGISISQAPLGTPGRWGDKEDIVFPATLVPEVALLLLSIYLPPPVHCLLCLLRLGGKALGTIYIREN